MTARLSAIAVTDSNTVDLTPDCKRYERNNGLDMWIVNETKYTLLSPMA